MRLVDVPLALLRISTTPRHFRELSSALRFLLPFIANEFQPTRKGRGSIFTANTRLNKAPAAFRNLDYAEAHGRKARTLCFDDISDTLA